MEVGFMSTSPASKHCGKSSLEALPQDILIRIVCGVDHDDLRALIHVSKVVQEVTLIAKKLHFEYSTPKKTVFLGKNIGDLQGDFGEFNEVVAPSAPRHISVSEPRFLNNKKLADISVALFTSDDDDDMVKWQCNKQFLHMTTPVLFPELGRADSEKFLVEMKANMNSSDMKAILIDILLFFIFYYSVES